MENFISSQDALNLLISQPDAYSTPDALRVLAAKVDAATASGSVTVLYSGMVGDGVHSHDVINAMIANGDDVRVIDKTEAAKFLDSREFKAAVAKAHGVLLSDFENKNFSSQAKVDANNWLFHPTESVWADASGRFADATVGEVRTLTGGADEARVFGQVEVPRILSNNKVTFIDGIALSELQSKTPSEAFKAIRAQSNILSADLKIAVDTIGKPIIDSSGTHIDARDFFASTPGVVGKVPILDIPMRRAIA